MELNKTVVAYVFVTGKEFPCYVSMEHGEKKDLRNFEWKVRRDKGFPPIVVINGEFGEMRQAKDEVKAHFFQSDHECLKAYCVAIEAVLEKEAIDLTLGGSVVVLTHWGGGLASDVSKKEKDVRLLYQKCRRMAEANIEDSKFGELARKELSVHWDFYSVSSLRNNVFDISRAHIEIPTATECITIVEKLKDYDGRLDLLTWLSMILAQENLDAVPFENVKSFLSDLSVGDGETDEESDNATGDPKDQCSRDSGKDNDERKILSKVERIKTDGLRYATGENKKYANEISDLLSTLHDNNEKYSSIEEWWKQFCKRRANLASDKDKFFGVTKFIEAMIAGKVKG